MKPRSFIRMRRKPASPEKTDAVKDAKHETVFFDRRACNSFFHPSHVQRKRSSDEIVQKDEMAAVQGKGSAGAFIHSLDEKGQALSLPVQQFFIAKMGYDFSKVKIHTGREAAESAKGINAKAYTVGNHVVFNERQYNTESSEGKKLMAHELVHVIQNNTNGQLSSLKRKIDFKDGKITKDIDMAVNYADGVKNGTGSSHSGITTPFLNGKDLTVTQKDHPFIIPAESDLSTEKENANYRSKVATEAVNSFTYQMHIPFIKKVWSTSVDASAIKKQLKKECPGMISVHIEGDPDSTTLVSKIQTHEEQHVKHWKELVTGILEPLDTKIKNATALGKTEQQSKQNLLSFIRVTRKGAYENFINQYTQKATDFHSAASGANVVFTAYKQDPDCMWIRVKAKI